MLLNSLLTLGDNPATVAPATREPVPELSHQSSVTEGFVAETIEAYDYEQQANRITDDYIHISALRGVCPRQYALILQSGQSHLRTVRSADKVMWALGRAAENHVRDSYISGVEFEGVYGKWVCRCLSSHDIGFMNPESHCDICDTPVNRYQELALFDNDNHIVGNPDLLIVKNGVFHVVEVKSVKGGVSTSKKYKGFDQLDRPLGDHIFQASMYRYLLQKNGMNVADSVIVLYVSKQYTVRDSPFKEYHVDVTTDQYQADIEIAKSNAKLIFDFVKEGASIPPRTLCENNGSPLAKQCPVVGRCFSGGV